MIYEMIPRFNRPAGEWLWYNVLHNLLHLVEVESIDEGEASHGSLIWANIGQIGLKLDKSGDFYILNLI